MGSRWQVMRDPDILPNWDPGAGEWSSVQKVEFEVPLVRDCWAHVPCGDYVLHDYLQCYQDHHCKGTGFDALDGLCVRHYIDIIGFKRVRYYS